MLMLKLTIKKIFSSTIIYYLIMGAPLLCVLVSQTPAWAATQQQQTPNNELGEDPGPVYTQVVMQWAKATNFAQNAAKVIMGKLKLDMQGNPKLQKVLTPALLADLEQFFYELFLSQETMKQLAIVYSQYFTIDEMQELLKFYQSALGQKIIKIDPELKIKTQQIGMKLLKQHERQYMEIIAKYVAPGERTQTKEQTKGQPKEQPKEPSQNIPAN